MKSKLTATLLAIISVAVILIASYWVLTNLEAETIPTTSSSPTPYPSWVKELPTYITELSQYQVNITQGESFQINLTITSFLNETKTFTPEVQLAGYANAAWDTSKDSHQVYNATVLQEQIVIGPQEKATTTVTFIIAQDAPLGKYVFYVTNTGLDVTVFPKAEIMSFEEAIGHANWSANSEDFISYMTTGELLCEPFVDETGIFGHLTWLAENGTLYEAEYPGGKVLGEYIQTFESKWNTPEGHYIWILSYGRGETIWIEAENGTIVNHTPRR